MKKILYISLLFLTTSCAITKNSIKDKDLGDIVEETSDLFFPEYVGDFADAVIDLIDN